MEREGGLVVGGRSQGRRTGWGSTASRFTLLPVPKEKCDSKQDDNGGARQDDVHVSNMEPLQVDRVLVATRGIRCSRKGASFAHGDFGRGEAGV